MRHGKGSKIFNTNAPYHGVPDWLLIQTFYNGLDQMLKMSIDVAASGALIGKSIEVARALLEEIASNNSQWSSEGAILKRTSRVYGVDAVDLLSRRVDTLAQ